MYNQYLYKDDLFGELGAISLFGLLGPLLTIIGITIIGSLFQQLQWIDFSDSLLTVAALVTISEVYSRLQDLDIFYIDFHIKVLIIGEAAMSSICPSILIRYTHKMYPKQQLCTI